MWIAMIAVGVVFACMLLASWNVMAGMDAGLTASPSVDKPSIKQNAPPEGVCLLCHAPIRAQGETSDEIVLALEKRIARETTDVSFLLHDPAPESIRRLYAN